ncbi:M56 family metallopeptidase [Paraclostridium bifermentans]|uniref:M56 family metallopeptidase n=2 Tax=Paraclostridium bifermentans TaxID=1490 RepID=UPI000A16D36B|nr:M56 family metallopeptidase [Paraclostridium bifermentans]OSB12382.1 hypothetical protein B2H97_04590 [Paraclostridium bifermentans]
MIALFNTIIYMSIASTIVAFIIILTRIVIYRRLPSLISYFLWSILLFRLIVPISFSSEISLFNLYPITIKVQSVDYKISNSEYSDNNTENTKETTYRKDKDSKNISYENLARVWAMVSVLLIIASVSAYIYTYNKFKEAIVCNELEKDELIKGIIKKEKIKIYKFSNLNTPIVCGIFKPKIIIPNYLLEEKNKKILINVLRHEMVHIRRRDYIIKLIALFITCIYWFNPIIWLSLILLHKDMERSCDEKVIKSSSKDIRREYAQALLTLAIKNKVNVSVLAFGESNTKKRIKGILRYKKSNFVIKILCIFVFITIAIFVATDASSNTKLINFSELKQQNTKNWVELEDISSYVVEAAVVSQDKDFKNHNGIDATSIIRAAINNMNSTNPKQGGSTITQQLVRNVCEFEKNNFFDNKRNEIFTAIKVDKVYSKNEIMEAYLNCINYGNDIVGIKNASLYYFKKKPSDLTKEESAKLMAIIDNPIMYDPINKKDNNEKKANIILKKI